MNKKSVLSALAANVLWGILPLYWALLKPLDSLFILAHRIIWSAVFVVALLGFQKKFPALFVICKDKKTMWSLFLSGCCITLQWGIYIMAVSSGNIMAASLGYYMNPLVVFAFGVFIFREPYTRLEIISLLLAATGVVLTTVQAGVFPFLPIVIALCFAIYGSLKKSAHIDSLIGVGIETLIVSPVAVLSLFLLPNSAASFAMVTPFKGFLLLFGGAMTALPLILYAKGVNELSFIAMGFFQYISPTLMFLIGLMNGEPFQLSQAISFGFIWLGLVIFSIGMVRRGRQNSMAQNLVGVCEDSD